MSLIKRIEKFNRVNKPSEELALVSYDEEQQKVGCESLNVTIYYDKESLDRDPDSYIKRSLEAHKTYLNRLDKQICQEIEIVGQGENRLNFYRGTKKYEPKVILKLQTLAMYLGVELILRPVGRSAQTLTNGWIDQAERKYDNYRILSSVMNYGRAFLEENLGNFSTLTYGIGETYQQLRYNQSKIPEKIKILEQLSQEQIQSAIESAKYFNFENEKEKITQVWNNLKQRVS